MASKAPDESEEIYIYFCSKGGSVDPSTNNTIYTRHKQVSCRLSRLPSVGARRARTGIKPHGYWLYAGWPLMSNTLKRTGKFVIASYPAQRIFTQKHSSRRLVQSSILQAVLPLRERVRLRRGKLSRKKWSPAVQCLATASRCELSTGT